MHVNDRKYSDIALLYMNDLLFYFKTDKKLKYLKLTMKLQIYN